jgi:IPT/TIG domain
MHMTHFPRARRIFPALVLVLGLLLVAGCNITITNLTSDVLRENPSQLYTLSVRVTPTSRSVDRSSLQVSAVIDGQSLPMHKSALADDVYEVDYPLPPGRDSASYYFLAIYRFNSSEPSKNYEAYSQVHHLQILRRYASPLQADRGPVGARVSIAGSGFAPQDVVYLDATPARTVYESSSALSFYVPPVQPDRTYNIAISGGGPTLSVGAFRVDAMSVSVNPSSLTMQSGDQQSLQFTLTGPAPQGGLLLDVTTDIPESVIMPEVVVPEGASNVVVTVQAAKPGAGALYLKGFGPTEITIPVSVTAK